MTTSSWQDFPFNTTTLSTLFEEATYSKEEVFNLVTLNTLRANIDIVQTMHFSMGRCYTLIPKVSTDFPVSVRFRNKLEDDNYFF